MFLSSAPMLDDESAARPRPLPVNERKLRRSSADSLMVSPESSEIQRVDLRHEVSTASDSDRVTFDLKDCACRDLTRSQPPPHAGCPRGDPGYAPGTDLNLSRRHLARVSRVNPRAGAAGYIHHIGKARLLRDAGGRARAKAAGADDRSRLVRLQIQTRQELAQLLERRGCRSRRVATLVLRRTTNVNDLQVRLRFDQVFQT